MIKEIPIRTRSQAECIDITSQIEAVVQESGVREGTCWVFIPHTTAGVITNEGADPSVTKDILTHLARLAPSGAEYDHLEGNSPAHIKSSLVGSSEILLVRNSELELGTWQSVFFCEFDGPRYRKILVGVM